MMALRTNAAWSAAVLTVDFGGAPQAWSPTAADSTAYEALLSFAVWIAASFPGRSMTWAWERDATNAGASITMTFDQAATIAANAAAQTLTGLPPAGGPLTAHTSTWAGTWKPSAILDLTRWVRWLEGSGATSGVGSLRSGVPGTAAHAPLLRTIATALDIARLMSELASAATPRQAWIYQEHTTTWRLVSVGSVKHQRVGPLLNDLTIEVLG